jgi:hypothetical protein
MSDGTGESGSQVSKWFGVWVFGCLGSRGIPSIVEEGGNMTTCFSKRRVGKNARERRGGSRGNTIV